jgi:hypothetical protein
MMRCPPFLALHRLQRSMRNIDAGGEFPISKGYNLLSDSLNGKGNATPWEVNLKGRVKVVAAQKTIKSRIYLVQQPRLLSRCDGSRTGDEGVAGECE